MDLHGSASYGGEGPRSNRDSDDGDDVISSDASGTRHRPSLFVENELKNNKNNDKINRSIKSSIKDKNKNKVTSELNYCDGLISNDLHSSKLLDDIYLKHELNNNEEIVIAKNTKRLMFHL
jgi:hypothetical protein